MKRHDCLSVVRSEYPDIDGSRSVYLTFDDGPNPLCTPAILDALAEHQCPATFFVIGVHAADQPGLVRRMIAEGHEVANHTMTHPDLSRCEPADVEHEIVATSRLINAACPQASVRHVRAPYGRWTDEVLALSAQSGLAALHWSVDPLDWSRPGVDSIVNTVLAAVRPGAVVLLHDGCPPGELELDHQAGDRDQTLIALSTLIPALRTRGFAIRPLPQLH
ncbi:chitooligosaccharide deacetylase NodB [Bradyrhizobium sp. ISRA443]|nr:MULTISPECIES: chitooligosaccharide deacetylase NodB [unclassified Bradyrhizobium]WGR93292.1 chitooligosaccharide deacetylase NodB [Bradyrhizobium sp. ISRA435]WGR97826.1 chitooligosaccharide deacetylase NodB [Bradyrhizobium sp. ISRA436]WGS04715.1 chitooligosaccharide deacetylase NodB [Bradyrhizobium sp. ISRA437]WGS11596.1 chitooligosaccharide deacetylase NodB [Bradyrhizobium sp. ISRA443]